MNGTERIDGAPASAATLLPISDVARLPASRVPIGYVPQNMDEAIKLSNMLAKSSLVPKDFQNRPENVFLALELGAELGLAPMQALQSIAVINGRPSIWGDGMLALVMSSGLLEYIEESLEENDTVGVCTVKRRDVPKPRTVRFSLEDAKKAGLLDKGGAWQTYPKRMLQMRPRSWALRDVFPDVLRGLIGAEEALDLPIVEKQLNDQIEMPRRKAIAAAPEGVDPVTGEVREPEPVTTAAEKPAEPQAAGSAPTKNPAAPASAGPAATEKAASGAGRGASNAGKAPSSPPPAKPAAPAKAPAPVAPAPAPSEGVPVISEDQRRQILGAVRKTHGPDAINILKAHLAEHYQIPSTKQLPLDKFAEVLAWAETPPGREPGEDG